MKHIEEVYAVVFGCDEFCEFEMIGVTLPDTRLLIATDPDQLERLREQAREVSRLTGRQHRLIRLSNREVLDWGIDPL